MAGRNKSLLVVFTAIMIPACAQLTTDFYEKSCPQALGLIRSAVARAINRESRMGASLLRLHFHDCFVNGCDGSILLDDTDTFTGEKTAIPNLNSVRGFDVVDEIKSTLNESAKATWSLLGGTSYEVLLGRRDARTASFNDANTNLPTPFFSFSQLVSIFESHGLKLKDLVVLSGGHTLGLARCVNFRTRIYNETNIDSNFTASMQKICPATGGDDNTTALDGTTPAKFDTAYFKGLIGSKGLLHSDQELFKGDGGESDSLVQYYNNNPKEFYKDFGDSVIKMGNMNVLTGNDGEIRMNCRKVNN
ncbi:Cationic peroxidase 1 [Morus notabilis]|uniref:Peroxidase n=1 Tax=Morus notabilis TaxID=981085 RepID=W9R4L3_9ROSA|nr:Cationic peroxidase 1 [Morus notabilis]